MSLSFYQKFGKRIFDLVFSTFGLILLSPIFLIISIIIKLTSKGPVIFKQKRVGKNGEIFIMYKFRTMVNNAENLKQKYFKLNEADGPIFKIKNDPRFTKIGKFLSRTGFDEIPQLFNVIKGEMSLVGPRPFPTNEEKQIETSLQIKRRKILPGLVSTWVASGANHSSFGKWIQNDLSYIRTYSFALDIKTILSTIKMLINHG